MSLIKSFCHVILISLLLVFYCPQVFAQQRLKTAPSSPTVSPTDVSSGPSMHSGAGMATLFEFAGAGVNAYVGYSLTSQCGDNGVACAEGCLALAQSTSQMAQALQSMGVSNATAVNPSLTGGSSSLANLTPQEKKIKASYDSLNVPQQLKNLAAKGYSVNPKTGMVSTPNGNMSAKDLSSLSGLEGLGMSAADAKKMLANIKRVAQNARNKYHVDAMGVNTGMGGGGYNNDSLPQYKFNANYGSMFGMGNNNKPAVAGLEKTVDGEAIGVESDNIFNMIHRRYRALQNRHVFYQGP